MVAARVSNTLINALPMSRPASAEAYQKIWDRAVGAVPPGKGAAEAVRYMKREYRDCRYIAELDNGHPGPGTSVRSCLGGVHDELMHELTAKVWKAVGAGS